MSMKNWATEQEAIVAAYKSHHPEGDREMIDKAFDLAVIAHAGQMRQSGDPYITHPLGVALSVAQLGLDKESIAAALCHDTVEDCATTLEDVERVLGKNVARMVDGVTKLEKVKSSVAQSRQNTEAKAGTLRKLLVAVADDIRVLIIKLCDRLHNVGSLNILPPEKAKRIAAETLEVYAPLAHRLGMSEIKWKLEDASFEVLYPERYREIVNLVSSRSPQRDRRLAKTVNQVKDTLDQAGIVGAVDGRAKHYWSIYSKMTRRNKTFDEIFDLLGVRVIVNSVAECYSALGIVHALYAPVPGRFKDYIAQPKFNSYAALHTTVVGPEGKTIELQIRTKEMHQRAEVGIAAHWTYKEGSKEEEPSWLTRLLDVHAETDDPDAFLQGVREDLAGEEIVCFTPKGQCLSLPVGAKPLDFAYAIHTQVGHHTIGAKINGRLLPLDTLLQTGDTVEIVTSRSEDASPQSNWLNLVVTSRAKAAIRSKLHKEVKEESVHNGREEVSRLLRSENLPSVKTIKSSEFSNVVTHFNFKDVDSLLAAVGEGTLEASKVVNKLKALLELSHGVQVIVPDAPPTFRKKRKVFSAQGLHAEGITDQLLKLAPCCSPIPGDAIMGYVTRGKGISVHREDCKNVPSLLQERARCIDVEWTHLSKGSFLVQVEVEGLDRSGLLADVTRTITDLGANIHSCAVETDSNLVAYEKFEVELADNSHLDKLLSAISEIDGVYSARRENA